MKLNIRHETTYRYALPVTYSMQTLHLTPRAEAHQRITSWNILTPGKLRENTDAFGNQTHVLTITQPIQEVSVVAVGQIEIENTQGLIQDFHPVPVMMYGVPTTLTQADARVKAFLANAQINQLNSVEDGLLLTRHIGQQVRYKSGVTEVTSTAEQALELGVGVCQDHAHLFLACARHLNAPARYVSGYFLPASATQMASHAWIDLWCMRPDGQMGWLSIDVTHECVTDDRHCRLAVARDYEGASPVRGVRSGGGREKMTVDVAISQDTLKHQVQMVAETTTAQSQPGGSSNRAEAVGSSSTTGQIGRQGQQ